MDLRSKLALLSNKGASEEDFAGLSVSPLENGQIEGEMEEDRVEDFNLGTLSIDDYLKSEGISSKKTKKGRPKKEEKTKAFDELLNSIDKDETDLGKYRTGNSDLDEATRRSQELLSQSDMLRAQDFDEFLDDSDRFAAEENAEMRTNLLSLGRKYARDSASSKESSEITKAYADTERRLLDLFQEVANDKTAIQRDIDRMRTPGRAGKIFSDMIAAKNSYHSTQLSILKELNAIKKNVFDLRAKEQARKDQEAQASNDLSANTLQAIFSSSRNSVVSSIGGYGSLSGSADDSETPSFDDSYEEDDETIQKKYFGKNPREETDGDKWLKYEGRGIEYVAILDDHNKVQRIIAEDRDGNEIPDYPLPSRVDQLSFDIDKVSMSATDNLHRNYKIRYQ